MRLGGKGVGLEGMTQGVTARPSIYDIARLADISAGSVSKILNGKGHFSDATRKRVRDIAAQQGYVANFAAKSLRELRSHSVGIITPDVSNEFFSSIVLDAEIALRERGYTSYICNFSNDASVEEACVRGLRQKQVDAFLFVGGGGAVSRELVGESTPVACVDRIGCGDRLQAHRVPERVPRALPARPWRQVRGLSPGARGGGAQGR
jgi:LacI family transcriptional regulator